MADCNHDCSSCGSSCSERTDFIEKPMDSTHVGKVIGVVSGKGGVGKSSVTSQLAVKLAREGYKVGILDADITGPSIPAMFGIKNKAQGDDKGIIPIETKTGIKIISMNLLLEDDGDPVVWRGPIIGGAVKQFWTDVYWGDLDYMLVDMPPGTGDVALTVFQSLPVDGIIIVATPQSLVSLIVEKAVRMANLMNVPVLGMVENMSYFKCPDCGKEHSIFGNSNALGISIKYGIDAFSRLPVEPKLAMACDDGRIEDAEITGLDEVMAAITGDAPEYEIGVGKVAIPYNDGEIDMHFGKAKKFKIFKIADLTLMGEEMVDAEGAGHEATVDLLYKKGVEIVICGGIGEQAVAGLAAKGIDVFSGASGDVDQAILDFIDGTLKCDRSGCGGCTGCASS